MSPNAETATPDIKSVVSTILDGIEREREREIIARRFGLFDRKETLEQIGELLGITRERVRQLEKAILIRLKIAAEEGRLDLEAIERFLVEQLHELGRAARLSELTERINSGALEREKARRTRTKTSSIERKRPLSSRCRTC